MTEEHSCIIYYILIYNHLRPSWTNRSRHWVSVTAYISKRVLTRHWLSFDRNIQCYPLRSLAKIIIIIIIKLESDQASNQTTSLLEIQMTLSKLAISGRTSFSE